MAIPTNYIKKRDQLHAEKATPASLAQVGREFFKLERYSDALDFFEKSRDADGIGQIKKVALERGDAFLLGRLDRYDRLLVTKEEWEAAAATAEGGGRASMSNFIKTKFLAPPEAKVGEAKPVPKPGEEPIAEV